MQKWKRNVFVAGIMASLAAGLLGGCGNRENQEKQSQQASQNQEGEEAANTGEGQEDTTGKKGNDKEEGENSGNTGSSEETSLAQAEHPQFVADGIRKVVLVEGGQEIFHLSKEPAEYKMDFDYWEILNPYDETVTVNTETMYNLFDILCGFSFQAPVAVEDGVDTGIQNSATTLTLEYVNTLDSSQAKQSAEADSGATIILGNEDGAGNRFAAVKGFEDQVYKLSATELETVFGLNPFELVLKIPVLINVDTVESLDIKAGGDSYQMKVDSAKGSYEFGKKEVEKETFTTLYQEISGVMVEKEIEEEKEDSKEPKLEITFNRNNSQYPQVKVAYYDYDQTYDRVEVNGNSYFLVKAEDVDNLIKTIQKAF